MNLKDYLDSGAGLSIVDLVRATGLTPPTIYRLRRGDPPTYRTAVLIQAATGGAVSLADWVDADLEREVNAVAAVADALDGGAQ